MGATLDILGLHSIRHCIIGDETERGISGGQRKRVNIGLEMVADPTVLFLDEPTSGLDSTSSMEVCDALGKIASLGVTVVTVIHQPRYEIFTAFDDVLLLGKGGRTVYLGPSDDALGYFESHGVLCPARVNPADFMMDVIAGNVPEGEFKRKNHRFDPTTLFVWWTDCQKKREKEEKEETGKGKEEEEEEEEEGGRNEGKDAQWPAGERSEEDGCVAGANNDSSSIGSSGGSSGGSSSLGDNLHTSLLGGGGGGGGCGYGNSKSSSNGNGTIHGSGSNGGERGGRGDRGDRGGGGRSRDDSRDSKDGRRTQASFLRMCWLFFVRSMNIQLLKRKGDIILDNALIVVAGMFLGIVYYGDPWYSSPLPKRAFTGCPLGTY